jgi:hypothetical protein
MALGVISAYMDVNLDADDREGNVLILLDRYAATIFDANTKVMAGLATLANLLVRRLAQETGLEPEMVLHQIRDRYALGN